MSLNTVNNYIVHTVVDFDTSNNELNIRPTPKVLVIGSTEHIQEELLIDDTSKSIGMSGSGAAARTGTTTSPSPRRTEWIGWSYKTKSPW